MPAAALDAVIPALKQELKALQQVSEALIAEHKALVDVDPGDLEQAILHKNQLLSELANLRRARETLTGTDSLVQFLDDNAAGATGADEARALIEELRSLGKACQQQNQSNGRLIAGLKENTEGALSVLRAGEASVTLYGQDGDRSSDLGSRILGTA